MQIRSLNHIKFGDLIECFNQSFADYFVKMQATNEFWKKRWRAARVDYSLSFGMFDGNDLVGFIINGIDYKNDLLTAFNSGTGVLPAYRGKRIVKKLYDFAIPVLIENDVKSCGLEVIVENEKAIKAYQRVGFEITKTLKCYSGKLNVEDFKHISTHKIPFEIIDWDNLPNQEFYSWDFQKSAIEIIKDNFNYFDVFEKDNKIGYVILNPKTGTIAQFDLVEGKNESDWQKLFLGIKSIVPTIKINNIDNHQMEKIAAVEKTGLSNTIDQFEMEYLIQTEN